MGDSVEVNKVVRRSAKSGKLDYAPPITLRETSKSRLRALGWFIPHTDRTEFALKLEGSKKQQGAWQEDQTSTMTLSEDASRELLKYLQTHLPVAAQSGTGEYLVIPIASGEADLKGRDPQETVGALMKVLGQRELVQHLAKTELTAELTAALRGAIRLGEMRAAMDALRDHLESGDTREQTYQSWCEQHSWAFGNAYLVHDDVRAITTGDNLDLLLPTVVTGYRDLVELKRPDMDVLNYDKGHRNFYFASEVSKAIGQCHRYLDMLHEAARKGLLDHEEVVAYHPRATIVIGRSQDWEEDEQRALHGLNRRMHGITVMTYDHLLAQGRRLIDLMHAPEPQSFAATPVDDDLPW